MSDRIEELRKLFRHDNHGTRRPVQAAIAARRSGNELLHHIDHLTAQLAERDSQIETLRAACERLLDTPSHYGDMSIVSGSGFDGVCRALGRPTRLESALGAPSKPGGKGT